MTTETDAAGFVTAYSKSTGREHYVPAHWFDQPELCRDLTLDPPPEVAAEQAEAEEQAAAVVPSMDWTRAQLDEHAASRGIDVSGAKNKAEVLEAIEAVPLEPADPAAGGAMGDEGLDNPALTAIGTAVEPPTDPSTTTPTETPAAGENQE